MKKLFAMIVALVLMMSMVPVVAEVVYTDSDTVRSVQQKLSDLGYNIGGVDGKLGKKTQSAIQDIQSKNGLDQTGNIDDALLGVLGLRTVSSSSEAAETIEFNDGYAVEENGIGDITLTPYATVKDAAILSDSNILKVSGKQAYYLAKMDGTPLTGDLYKELSCTSGWVTGKNVEIEGWNQGVLSAIDGSIVVPFVYGDIKILNKNWGLAFNLVPASADNYDYESWTSSDYYLIDTVDVYWLPTASKLATIPRVNYMDSKAYDAYLNIEDRETNATTTYDLNMNPLGTVSDIYSQDCIPHYSTFRYNGQQGLLDPDGNEVFPASYQYVNESGLNGFFEVSIGDMNGLVDSEGNVVVPVDYSKINRSYYSPSDLGSTFVNFGYVCVEKDKCLGYYRINNSESCPPKYSSVLLENNGVSALFTDMSGNLNILAADGEENILTGYEKVYPLNNAAGSLYKANNADYKYGLIDWHSKEILPVKYDSIELSSNGHYLLASESYSTPAEIYYVSYGGSVESGQEAEAADDASAMSDESYETVKSLIGSAEFLVKADYASNKATVKVIFGQALSEATGADQELTNALNSVITLLDSGNDDESAILSLIYYIRDMLE